MLIPSLRAGNVMKSSLIAITSSMHKSSWQCPPIVNVSTAANLNFSTRRR